MPEIKPATQELSIRIGHPSDERRVKEITTEILQQKGQVVCSFIRIGQLLDVAKGCANGTTVHSVSQSIPGRDISVAFGYDKGSGSAGLARGTAREFHQ